MKEKNISELQEAIELNEIESDDRAYTSAYDRWQKKYSVQELIPYKEYLDKAYDFTKKNCKKGKATNKKCKKYYDQVDKRAAEFGKTAKRFYDELIAIDDGIVNTKVRRTHRKCVLLGMVQYIFDEPEIDRKIKLLSRYCTADLKIKKPKIYKKMLRGKTLNDLPKLDYPLFIGLDALKGYEEDGLTFKSTDKEKDGWLVKDGEGKLFNDKNNLLSTGDVQNLVGEFSEEGDEEFKISKDGKSWINAKDYVKSITPKASTKGPSDTLMRSVTSGPPLNLSIPRKSALNVSKGSRNRYSKKLIRPTQSRIESYLQNRKKANTGITSALKLYQQKGTDGRYGFRTHKAATVILGDILDLINRIQQRRQGIREHRLCRLNKMLMENYKLQGVLLNEQDKPCPDINKIKAKAEELMKYYGAVQRKNPKPGGPKVLMSVQQIQELHNFLGEVDIGCLLKELERQQKGTPAAATKGPPEELKTKKEPRPDPRPVGRDQLGVGACFDERYRSKTQIFKKPAEIFKDAGLSWEKLYDELLVGGVFRVQNTDFSFDTGSVGYMPAQPGIFSYINIKKGESGNVQCLRVYLENLRGILASLIRMYQEDRATDDVKAMYGGGDQSIARQAHSDLAKVVKYITLLIETAEQLKPPAAQTASGQKGMTEENPFPTYKAYKDFHDSTNKDKKVRANKIYFLKSGSKVYKYVYDVQGNPPKSAVPVQESLKQKREKLLKEAIFKKLVK